MYTMYIATTPLFFPLLEQHVQEVMKRKMDTMHHVTKSSHRIVFKKTVPLRYEAQNRWECGDMPKGYHALVVNGSYPEVKRVVLSLAHEASYPLRYAPLEELSHESFAAELSVSLLEHRANKQPFLHFENNVVSISSSMELFPTRADILAHWNEQMDGMIMEPLEEETRNKRSS